jgi:hypothetical protein
MHERELLRGLAAFALVVGACRPPSRLESKTDRPASVAPVPDDATITQSEDSAMDKRSDCKPISIEELHQRVDAALGSRRTGLQLTPALPPGWPQASGKPVFFAYPVEDLPTGIISTRIHAPSHRITVASSDDTILVEPLASTRVLGTERSQGARPDPAALARAEQALVDVIAGCRATDDAAADLGPYLEWLDDHDIIAQDLEQRVGGFLAWLRASSHR